MPSPKPLIRACLRRAAGVFSLITLTPSVTAFETFDAVSTALSATPLAVAVIASPAEDIMLCALAGIFTSSIFLRS